MKSPVYQNPNPVISGLNQNLDKTFAISTHQNGTTRLRIRQTRKTPAYSANQYLSQVQFQEAAKFAKLNQTSSFFKEQSKLRKQKAYQLALSHFRQRPVVLNLNIVHNKVETANLVRFQLLHPVTLASLTVTITDSEPGTEIKTGSPVLVDELALKYEFEFPYINGNSVQFSINADCNEWEYKQSMGPVSVPAGKAVLKGLLPIKKKKRK
ncbi:MAG: hypothetical protein J0L62_05165 [Bacteroidetes bacterium]|nr:hypothetical protein [Bacteroidota bacterium]